MLPQAAAARTRPRIGRYLITGRIGRGGMGMVYRGLDEALEREVAVKTLTAEGTLDAESRQRFEREARAAAREGRPGRVMDPDVPFAARAEPGRDGDLRSVRRDGRSDVGARREGDG